MERFGLTFHHLGVAIRTPDSATLFLAALGYEIGPQVYDPEQNVLLCYCKGKGMPDIELVTPTSTPGPLDRLLAERSEVIYHKCFQVGSLEESVASMKQAGFRLICVSEPKPAVLFGGNKVGFYHVKGFGLIELLEYRNWDAHHG